MSRLAAARYEPFAMLAFCWCGKPGQTIDDFNPYQIAKRAAAASNSRRVTFAQLQPLLQQWVPS